VSSSFAVYNLPVSAVHQPCLFILTLQAQRHSRAAGDPRLHHQRLRDPTEEGAHPVPGEGADPPAQTARSGHLPPPAVVLHLAVRREGPRDHRDHRQRPRTLLALDQRREAGTFRLVSGLMWRQPPSFRISVHVNAPSLVAYIARVLFTYNCTVPHCRCCS
jgi:hypothetical protein